MRILLCQENIIISVRHGVRYVVPKVELLVHVHANKSDMLQIRIRSQNYRQN